MNKNVFWNFSRRLKQKIYMYNYILCLFTFSAQETLNVSNLMLRGAKYSPVTLNITTFSITTLTITTFSITMHKTQLSRMT